MSKNENEAAEHTKKQNRTEKNSKKRHLTGPEIARRQLWATYIGAGATVLGLVIGILTLVSAYSSLSGKVGKVESDVLTGQFIVTAPENGANVGPTDIVGGKTPYPDMQHYVVVTPLETPEDWVQEKPVRIYAGGLWTGTARFGTGEAGVGKKFTIRCLATRSTLEPGTSNPIPPDAKFSVPISVTRTQ